MKIDSRLGSPWVFAVATLVVGAVGWLTAEVPVPWDAALLGTAVCGLGLLPIFRWARRGDRSMPMFELVCISFTVQYGFAVFSVANAIVIQSRFIEIPWSVTRGSLLVAGLGIAALQLGFAFGQRGRKGGFSLDLPVSPRRRPWLVLTCVALSFVGMVLPVVGLHGGVLGGILNFFGSQSTVAVALLTIDACDAPAGPTRVLRYFWLGAYLMFIVFIGLGSGMLEGVALPCAVALVIRMARTRDFPVFLLTAMVAVLAVLNSAKMEVRKETWNSSGHSHWEKIEAWGRAISHLELGKMFEEETSADEVSSMRTLLYRFSLLNRLSWVRMNSPEPVPYFAGASYKYFIYAPIPRVLWPGKPIIADATSMLDFAYELRDPNQGNTYSIGVGFVGEAVANFSWPGVALVMALLGSAMGAAHRILNGPLSFGGAALFAVAMTAFINGIGTTLVILCGSMVQIMALCVALIWIFAGRLSAPQRFVPGFRNDGKSDSASLVAGKRMDAPTGWRRAARFLPARLRRFSGW